MYANIYMLYIFIYLCIKYVFINTHMNIYIYLYIAKIHKLIMRINNPENNEMHKFIS